jgi:hypothetical protein
MKVTGKCITRWFLVQNGLPMGAEIDAIMGEKADRSILRKVIHSSILSPLEMAELIKE